MLRQLLVAFVGHVDHGKTSIQDKIRGTAVALAEPGLITQSISCTNIAYKTLKNLCKDLTEAKRIKIPGFLFLDTPGHASFTNLRKRGGSLADIAVLVIDINEGVKPQTIEVIEILKQFKTPFIIAANKIDLIPGWKSLDKSLIANIKKQAESTQELLDKKIYTLVGQLYEYGFNSEKFDKVEDYTKQIAIVPTSAKTGDGLAEMLMVLTGLAQKFLEKDLEIDIKKPGKAVVLEVKESKGLGTYLDTIIYDGTIKINDIIIIGGLEKPIITKIRNLFVLKESAKKVNAADNIKILAPNIKEVVSGMPLRVANTNIEKISKEIQAEVKEVLIETDKAGIVVKADSLGSLEALISLLKEKNIKIKLASIGEISKKDVAEASSEEDPLNKVILGFNIKQETIPNIKVICHKVIYKILEDLEKWKGEESKLIEFKEISSLVRPCKFIIMPHYIFRQSHPAVVGIDLISGNLKTNTPIMKENGQKIGIVKSIQSEGENINEGKSPAQIAVSLPKITIGRQVYENDVIYSDIPEEDFIKFKKLKKYLNKEEIQTLKEIANINRKKDQLWGV